MPLPRITRKRRFVQGVLISAALLLPFVTISGNPFLRMDIAKNFPQFGKVQLELFDGDQAAAAVTVSP